MSDPVTPTPDAPAVVPAEAWKPEPRQWSWRDLFTAPMLAFKPKCMLVSALTLAAIGAWMWLYAQYVVPSFNPNEITYTSTSRTDLASLAIEWAWYLVALVIFSLGAGLVAVFMKADLLDDEFLSFGEALAQYKSRVLSAVLVPVFLVVLLLACKVLLVFLPVLAGNIPGFGPVVYALLYPLGYLASLFVVLLGIAVWLSVFVFPAVIAIRRHGWFDNVVDTIEAVGTKPHLLLGSLLLTLVMVFFAFRIGEAGMAQMRAQSDTLPKQWPIDMTEGAAHDLYFQASSKFDALVIKRVDFIGLRDSFPTIRFWPKHPIYPQSTPGFYEYTGWITGGWQVLILALIVGYGMNLFVAGGMLSYLVVREDDFWDDEDLEDLDKLAKELEEEAKQEQAAESGTPTTPAATPTVDAPKPGDQPGNPA